MFSRFSLTTLLGVGVLVGAALQPERAFAANDTPFTLNLNGTPTEWRTHDESRPQPPRAKNPVFQGLPAPAGADILFDGTSFDAWEALKSKGGQKPWIIQDGALIAQNNDIRTKKSYGDARLHIEWRIPKELKSHGSQSGTNSGVMFGDGLYEIQVLEVHPETNKTYPDGMAGGIYAQFPPLYNAALPKGEWQSYDIYFTAPRFDEKGLTTKRARFTVVWNGIVVQDDQELVGDCSWRGSRLFPTAALVDDVKPRHGHKLAKAHPARLPLRLQWHGDPVQFRNIWIVDLEKDSK